MFMLKSTHEGILASEREVIASAERRLAAALSESRTKGRLAAEALAERDAAIARAEAAEARFQMKHRQRDAKGHFLPAN